MHYHGWFKSYKCSPDTSGSPLVYIIYALLKIDIFRWSFGILLWEIATLGTCHTVQLIYISNTIKERFQFAQII